MALLEVTPQGLFCAAGGFHIDPSRSVERALITHAHSDHARPGSQAYLCAAEGESLLRIRVGRRSSIQGSAWGERLRCGEVTVSFHPAGHVLGSAQIRVEHRGEIWVVSGDYKRASDPTCAGFELVRCHTFITESTFGLPIYRWPNPADVFHEMTDWWHGNQAAGRTSVVFAYSIGKAQRILASLDPDAGPFLAHPAVLETLPAYQAAGVALPAVRPVSPENVRAAGGRALAIGPPAAGANNWLEALGPHVTAFASGWMALSRARHRPGFDRGFVLSDHADWDGLTETIRATGAERVFVTHGYVKPLVRWLREQRLVAQPLAPPDAVEHGVEHAGSDKMPGH